MLPAPPKPFTVIKNENKSHRTKSELEQRKQGEQSLLTGKALKEHPEVKNNLIAHKEFLRINDLLKRLEKNDAIYESVINRYCIIYAECVDFETKRESFYGDLQEITADKDELIDSGEMTLSDYYKTKSSLQGAIISIDKQIHAKRKMIFDLEKENIMTIASALRSIPKKTEKASNKVLEVLSGD